MWPPLPWPSPVCFAEDLCRHQLHVHPVGESLVVWPVGRGDRVGGAQLGTYTGGDGLLPGGQMHLAGNRSPGDVKGGVLPSM